MKAEKQPGHPPGGAALRMLKAVQRRPGSTAVDIAREMGRTKRHCDKVLALLMHHGLVQLRESPRVHRGQVVLQAHLTTAGSDAIKSGIAPNVTPSRMVLAHPFLRIKSTDVDGMPSWLCPSPLAAAEASRRYRARLAGGENG